MKKRYLKTVEDIKYCEENNLVIRDAKDKICSYAFEGNCWVYYLEGQPALYNASIRLSSKLYYEEEPMQEATEKDIGKLCWFWDTYTRKVVGKLREILQDDNFPFRSDYGIPSIHCRPLTKEEIKEFMEKAE